MSTMAAATAAAAIPFTPCVLRVPKTPSLPLLTSSSLHSLSSNTIKPPSLKALSSRAKALRPQCSLMAPAAQGDLALAKAYWVSKSLIAWNINNDDAYYYIYASRTACLYTTSEGIAGEDLKIQIEVDDGGLPKNVTEKFPHIRDYRALRVPDNVDAGSLLKCQLAVACFNGDGNCASCTGLQLPGVIDDLFSYDGPLGAIFTEETVSLYLWAPTAQRVLAYIYSDPSDGDPLETVELKESDGVWSVNGPRTWEGHYYAYEVSVFHPSTLHIETCLANDPYARGLSADGKRSLFINLDCSTLKPEEWDQLADEKPALSSISDMSIYELHIRDFSASDDTVNPELRGGYLAFTLSDYAGMLHLTKLAKAGLTHVHLLPSFHFAGVDDEKENWKYIDEDKLASLPPDSVEQQAEVVAIQHEDGYNWGYNPVLWGVPKGSYATNPSGSCRTLEFRKLVQSLNRAGLRVILDVVYNHLHGNGPFDVNSVLDKVVPGYYLRRNSAGLVEHSTCTNNTACEHFMVERLIIDDLLLWAVKYKIDGFRFDLMGHLMKGTMLKAKIALHSLTTSKDGVDGSKIYVYGEGWDFGEVAKNARGVNASQFNLGGTGIGSFNDRIRDAVVGGSPFGPPLQQGFVTGLSLQPNEHDYGGEDVTERTLAVLKDHIQVGLAANLHNFVFTNHRGESVKGSDVHTHDGLPVAYAQCPTETINYVSAHDNETLFDAISLKTAAELSMQERCRVNHLATSIIALSQGIPFFHAGDEILRSKSLDRDSYNSGDWFNRLDFSYESNNWGVGLPPKEKNGNNWPLIKPLLANASYKPLKSQIISAVQNLEDLLRIRYSSLLFRLQTADSIQERVRFHNTGPSSIPGLIVMSLEDGHMGMPGLTQIDPIYSFIVVTFNAQPHEVAFTIHALRARMLQLHPIQLASGDNLVKCSLYEARTGSFKIPGRTTTVFVENR
ncbi:hypothetical protein AMTRI_Chr07g77910 [Amborella trichopoda]